jgi:hypothetical protein
MLDSTGRKRVESRLLIVLGADPRGSWPPSPDLIRGCDFAPRQSASPSHVAVHAFFGGGRAPFGRTSGQRKGPAVKKGETPSHHFLIGFFEARNHEDRHVGRAFLGDL